MVRKCLFLHSSWFTHFTVHISEKMSICSGENSVVHFESSDKLSAWSVSTFGTKLWFVVRNQLKATTYEVREIDNPWEGKLNCTQISHCAVSLKTIQQFFNFSSAAEGDTRVIPADVLKVSGGSTGLWAINTRGFPIFKHQDGTKFQDTSGIYSTKQNYDEIWNVLICANKYCNTVYFVWFLGT